MNHDSTRYHRRSIRLKNYDYSRPGAYFVTICIKNYAHLLGEIVDGEMHLNKPGMIVTDAWKWLAQRFDHVDLDVFVIMPNHLHGIILLPEPCRGGSRTAPTANENELDTSQNKPLGRLIGAFKTISTKHINQSRQTSGLPVWQRNYWEHIIRNESALHAVRRYIARNPQRWDLDRYNPNAVRSVRYK